MISPKTAALDAALLLLAGLSAAALATLADRLADRPAGRRCSRAAMAAGGFGIGASLLWFTDGEALAIGLLLGWTLLTAVAVDVLAYRLPNVLTLPLIAAGVLAAWLQQRSVADALLGALGGFLVLWAADLAYRAIRGRSGIGLGDAKLFCAAGAWLGWQALPSALLLSCAGGLAWAAVRILRGQGRAADPLPLGPPMALGFWLLWLLQNSNR